MEQITKYNKITTGFVTQEFTQQDGKYICVEQSFTAGDQSDREDDNGEPVEIDIKQEVYEPFDMKQPNPETAFEKWFKKNKNNDEVQKYYRKVIEQNPDYELCFKDWCKKYFQECVDI